MLGVIGLVVGRIAAYDVDDRCVGPAGIVGICDPVCKATAHMQQSKYGFACPAPVSVGSACHHVLLQAENSAHAFGRSDFVDELHLGCAGIGETGVEACVGQCLE